MPGTSTAQSDTPAAIAGSTENKDSIAANDAKATAQLISRGEIKFDQEEPLSSRQISSEVVRRGLLNNLGKDWTQLVFSNAIINGSLNCYLQTLPAQVIFRNCQFDSVEFGDAIFESNITFEQCIFRSRVNFAGAEFGKSISFAGSTFNDALSLATAQIQKDLNAEKTKFLSEDAIVEFNSMRVGGSATFHKTQFNGAATFSGINISGFLRLDEAKFLVERTYLFFDLIKVGNGLYATEAEFRCPVYFYGCDIGGDTHLSARFLHVTQDKGAPFIFVSAVSQFFPTGNALFCRNTRFGGSLFLAGCEVLGSMEISDSTITGDLIASNGYFQTTQHATDDPDEKQDTPPEIMIWTSNFSGSSVSRNVRFEDCEFGGSANFSGMAVGGRFSVRRSQFSNSLGVISFTGLTAKGFYGDCDTSSPNDRRTRFCGQVSLNSATFEHLTFSGAHFLFDEKEGKMESPCLDAIGLNIRQTVGNFRECHFEGQVLLQHAYAALGFDFTKAEFSRSASLDMNNAETGGELDFSNTVFSGVGIDARRIKAGANVTFDGSEFLNINSQVNFSGAAISGDLSLAGGKFNGPVYFNNAFVNGSVNIDMLSPGEHTFFKNGFSFSSGRIGKAFLITGARFKGRRTSQNDESAQRDQIYFDGIEVEQDLRIEGAEFDDLANFTGAHCRGIYIESRTDGIESQPSIFHRGLSLYSAFLGADLSVFGVVCSDRVGSSSDNVVSAQGMEVSSIHVGRNLRIEGCSLLNGLFLNRARVDGLVSLAGTSARCQTGADLHSELVTLDLRNAWIGGFLDLGDGGASGYEGKIALDHTTVGTIYPRALENSGLVTELSITGMKFDGFYNSDEKESTTDEVLQFFGRADFNSEHYVAYEKALREKGKDDDADTVFFEMKNAGDESPRHWKYRLWYALTGYGKHWWNLLVWPFGAALCMSFVFTRGNNMVQVVAAQMETTQATRTLRTRLRRWGKFFCYALILVVPFENAAWMDNWQPKDEEGWTARLHDLLQLWGWIMLVLAITMFVR